MSELRRAGLVLMLGGIAACTFDRSGLSTPPTQLDSARPADQRADRRPVDRRIVDGPRIPDRRVVDKPVLPDRPPPPDVLPPDTKDPCDGCVDICCDKGLGLQCYTSSDGCTCDLTTKVPCKGTGYSVCCDKWSGPKCTNTYADCACDPASSSPCNASTVNNICCDKGQGQGTRCTSSANGCLCDGNTAKPCTGTYDVCCQVSGPTWKCDSWPC
jgi:hypothetical protein